MPRNLFERFAFLTLWLFVATIPVEKTLEMPGIGTVSRVAGAVAMAAGAMAVLITGRLRHPALSLVAAALFAVWSIMSRLWTLNLDETQERTATYLPLLVLAVFLWQFCRTTRQIRQLAIAYACGMMYSVGDTVYRWMTRASQIYYQRFANEGFDPNDLALTLAIGIPFLYWLSLTAETRKAAWMWRAAIGLAAFNIFLTASRGGAMALAAALVIVPLTLRLLEKRDRTLIAVGAIAAGMAVAYAVPAASWARLATLGKEAKEGTLNSRTLIWATGLQAFSASPVLGVGSGAFPESVRATMGRPREWTPVAHNTFLSILVETGLAGFAIFMALAAAMIWSAFRLPWLERRLWLVVLAVWTIGVSALTWEHRKPTWLLFALLPTHAAAIVAVPKRNKDLFA
jgi:O-antigen ligase